MKITSKVIDIQHTLFDEEGHKKFMSEVRFLPMSTNKARFFVIIEVNSCNDDKKIYKMTTKKTASDATAKALLAEKLVEYVTWRQKKHEELLEENAEVCITLDAKQYAVKGVPGIELFSSVAANAEKEKENEEEVEDPAFATGGMR